MSHLSNTIRIYSLESLFLAHVGHQNYYLHNNKATTIINTFKIDGIFFLYKAKWAQVHEDLFFPLFYQLMNV